MEQARTVLVVDDHARIVEILRDYLEAAGFVVRTAADGQAALDLLAKERVHCVVLDVMLPGIDGYEVCRRMRATSDVPVLFLSARDDDAHKLRGLGLGDDYIVKAASPAEIVARVKAVLRRAARDTPGLGDGEGLLDFGRFVLDTRGHEARVAGQRVPLTAREFALLSLLAAHPRQVLTREQLIERIWGGYSDESTLWGYIRRLREKIEEDPAHPRYIVTVWGVGYRFEGRQETSSTQDVGAIRR
jgi:DNA-binding response OmpR family regulator